MAERKVGVFKVADRPGLVPAAGCLPPHRSGQIDPPKTTKGRHMTLSEGDKAPAFSLPADGGGRVSLADFKGRKLALFFYPKADTEGCTREALDFTALARSFAKAGTDILGRLRRSGRPAGRLQAQAQAENPAGLGRDPESPQGLWGLGREIDVWPQIHGNHAHDLADRARRPDRADLAQGAGSQVMRRRCSKRRKSFRPDGAGRARWAMFHSMHSFAEN